MPCHLTWKLRRAHEDSRQPARYRFAADAHRRLLHAMVGTLPLMLWTRMTTKSKSLRKRSAS